MAEILKKINKNLTLSPVLRTRKEWIATAAMLAASAAASIFGGSKAAKAAKKAKAEQKYRSDAQKAWYDKEYNTDYLDTKAGSNLMRRAQEVQDKAVKRADGAAKVGGATAASVAQSKESANKVMGDAVASIASGDTARKRQVSDGYLNSEMQTSREREQSEQARAAAVSGAAQNMSNALTSAAMTQMGSDINARNSLSTNNNTIATPTVDNTKITQLADKVPNPLKNVATPKPGLNGLGADPLELATGVHHGGKVW